MIKNYRHHTPQIDESVYLSKDTVIIGDVTLEKNASVWFHSVIRGDKDHIHIGEGSNIQDNCTLHTDPDHVLTIGRNVTVGHNAVLHGCTIEDEVLIGMGAIILNGATIGRHSIIGAGALIKEQQVIPERSLVVGCPGKVIKNVSEEQIQDIMDNAQHYQALAKEYKEMK